MPLSVWVNIPPVFFLTTQNVAATRQLSPPSSNMLYVQITRARIHPQMKALSYLHNQRARLIDEKCSAYSCNGGWSGLVTNNSTLTQTKTARSCKKTVFVQFQNVDSDGMKSEGINIPVKPESNGKHFCHASTQRHVLIIFGFKNYLFYKFTVSS